MIYIYVPRSSYDGEKLLIKQIVFFSYKIAANMHITDLSLATLVHAKVEVRFYRLINPFNGIVPLYIRAQLFNMALPSIKEGLTCC